MARACVFLVHGVGLPPENVDEAAFTRWLFGGDLTAGLDRLGIGDRVELVPIDWHRIVPDPRSSEGFLNTKQVRSLMRGFIGGSAAFADRVSRAEHLLAMAALVLPLALLMAAALSVARAEPPFGWPSFDNSLGWTLSSARYHLRQLLSWILPGPLLQWAPPALFGYGILLAMLTLAHGIHSARQTGALNALRSVSVALVLRPLAFAAAALVSGPALGLYACYTGWRLLSLVVLDRYLAVTSHPDFGVVPHAAMSMNDQYLINYLLLLGVAGGTVFLARRIVRVLALPMKLVADVICFMGDPDYADGLLARVQSEVGRRSGHHDNFVFIGHSLGSAVLFRWLLTKSNSLPASVTVTFVTMASPIRRWLARFYPSTFPSAEEGARWLKARYPSFAWLNVYRPLDPVGGRLFRESQPWLQDHDTRQFTRGHTGFWNDPLVIAVIHRFATQCDRGGTTAMTLADLKPAPWFPSEGTRGRIRLEDRLGKPTAKVLAVLLGGYVGLYAGMAARNAVRMDSAEVRRDLQASLDAQGRTTKGWIYVYREFFIPVQASGPRAEDGPLTVSQRQMDSRPILLTRQLLLFHPGGATAHVCFDLTTTTSFRLAGFSLEGGEEALVRERSHFKRARRYSVDVLYLPDDPRSFTLPGHEAMIEPRGAFGRLFATLITAASACAFCLGFWIVSSLVGGSIGELQNRYCARVSADWP